MWKVGTAVTLFLMKAKRHAFLLLFLPSSSLKKKKNNKELRIPDKPPQSHWEGMLAIALHPMACHGSVFHTGESELRIGPSTN